MNLVQLKQSRKKLRAGDIFVFSLRQEKDRYRFGKIINTETNIGGFVDCSIILIYLYNVFSYEKQNIPNLNKNDLLLAPLGINRLPWIKGYFENVGFEEVTTKNTLSIHCFKDSFKRKETYFNEFGKQIKKAKVMIGEYGLHSFMTIDDAVSEALGYPIEP